MVKLASVKCHYCQGSGHWKNKCPVLRAMGKFSTHANIKPKPTALAAPVPHLFTPVTSSHAQVHVKFPIDPNYYILLLRVVCLLGSNDPVPVKILRDTSASELIACSKNEGTRTTGIGQLKKIIYCKHNY